MPLVVLDPLWYSMKAVVGSDIVEKKEKELNELLKERGKLNTDAKEYGAVKKNLMQNILEVSQEVNASTNPQKADELDKLHKTVTKTTELQEEIEKRAEEVDELIIETNTELVQEAMAIAYEYMANYQESRKELDEEIDYLRQQLLLKTEQKKQYEKKYTEIYNYVHKVIGYKYIDTIDKKIGEE